MSQASTWMKVQRLSKAYLKRNTLEKKQVEYISSEIEVLGVFNLVTELEIMI